MGFMLIYLTPAFFTDTSEGFTMAARYQRLIIAMAGAWAELIICAIATPIWWATPPDTMTHEAAYLLMLMTGIASLMINWNPLMKLDGYYILCEIIGIADLKAASTAYVSAWVKHKIWGLPVKIPYVPRRHRLGFVIYALLSGLYSYTVLYILARFVGNVFRNFNPEWSFLPELATAALIFRSRIRTLVNFMKFVYLDKVDRWRVWLGSHEAVVTAGALAVFLVLPLWHESATGRFALEPATRAVVRNPVPGTVAAVYAAEGMPVRVGTTLLRLRNSPLESKVAAANADYEVASKRVISASLHYANLGTAVEERNQLAQRARQLQSQASHLELNAPISGIVLTPRLSDRLGAFIPEGAELVEIGDLHEMRARIYVSEHDLYKIRLGALTRLFVEGVVARCFAQASAITPASSELEAGLAGSNKYQGLRPPRFYLVDALILNSDSSLKPGMVGTAKIYGQRRSLAGLIGREMERFFARKAW
jgi:putative peptide zinc metalloprotease protein